VCCLPRHKRSSHTLALLESLSSIGAKGSKSLQPYLFAINVVQNDRDKHCPQPPACGWRVKHARKHARKGFAELKGSAMLQPQQVTAFPEEHNKFTVVEFGLRPDASKDHIFVTVFLRNSPSSAALTRESFLLLSTRKLTPRPAPLTNRPRTSREIKQPPLRECPQLKTIRPTASTNSSWKVLIQMSRVSSAEGKKELNDFQRNLLDIEILSNLRFGSLEIRDTSVTRVTNNYSMYSTFPTATPGSVLFNRSDLLAKKKGSSLLVPQARPYKAS
jgi:hypothetical protein